jgi:hypothetical protein
VSSGRERERASKSAHVFVTANPDGSFTVGRENRTHAEAFRVDAFALVDLIWQARRALKLAKAGDEDADQASAC